MLKPVRNWDETSIPKITTATRARTSPDSQRTSPPNRSRRSCAKVRPPPPERRGEPERDVAVEHDRPEQQRAGDRLVPERRDAEDVERREDRLEQERAERRPDDAAAAAEDRDAADDDRCDHLQLVAHAGGRVDRSVAGRVEHAGDPRDPPAHEEGGEDA